MANPLTTWGDIFLEREKVIRAEKEDAERMQNPHRGEDYWDDEIDLEVETQTLQSGNPIYAGMRTGVIERDLGTQGSATRTYPSPSHHSTHQRQASLGSGHQKLDLPTFLVPTDASSLAGPSPQRPSINYPVLSHLPAPHPRPQVNYKHLYLLHGILRQRFKTGKQRATILNAATSIANGGLDSHQGGVYCLQILNQELVIPIDTEPSAVASSPRRTGADPIPTQATIEGRNWVFSGSRDRTIRLWDLNTSRVVKIYQASQDDPNQGHTGSVLTLHARSYGNGKGVRLISGGSDGKLVIWNATTGEIEGQIQAHERGESVLCVRFDDKRIVCCSKGRWSFFPNHSIRHGEY